MVDWSKLGFIKRDLMCGPCGRYISSSLHSWAMKIESRICLL